MQTIETNDAGVLIYTGESGRAMVVIEMPNPYLINAMLKAERAANAPVVELLKAELFRRLDLAKTA